MESTTSSPTPLATTVATSKNGNSLILDPYGDIMTEIRSFEDTITIATLTEEKLGRAGGRRYRNARKPELYRDILGADHRSETKPAWLSDDKNVE